MRHSTHSLSKSTQGGFGLIGIVVSFAALALMAVAFSQLILNSKKGQLGVRNSMDFDVLRSSINTVLKDPVLCSAGLKNTTNSSTAVFKTSGLLDAEKLGSIYIGTTAIAKVEEKIGNGLILKKLDIERLATDATSDAPNIIYSVRLNIEAVRTKGSVGIPTLTALTNVFSIKTNSAGVILSCPSANVASSLQNILKNTNFVELAVPSCLNNTGTNNTVTVACNGADQLLSCAGGPGSVGENSESYWVTPNFNSNTCTLTVAKPACDLASVWTQQKVTAICFTP